MKIHNFRLSAVVVLVLLLAIGCAPVSYIGNSYEPTNNVDIYFSADDIKMEYTVIGHALGADGWQKNQKRIKEALIKDAKENGADAVLITGMEREVRSPWRIWNWHVDNEVTALFLKYK